MADTKTATTITEELKTAAKALRETAAKTTRGPWVPYPTITADQHDEAWTISRTLCDKDPCEPDCGHTVLTTGAEGCEEDNVRGEDVSWICLVNPLLAEPLAAWLDKAAQDMAKAVYEDEEEDACARNWCGPDCPGHPKVLVCDECGGRFAPISPKQGSPCRCWDAALAVARALNGTSPQERTLHG